MGLASSWEDLLVRFELTWCGSTCPGLVSMGQRRVEAPPVGLSASVSQGIHTPLPPPAWTLLMLPAQLSALLPLGHLLPSQGQKPGAPTHVAVSFPFVITQAALCLHSPSRPLLLDPPSSLSLWIPPACWKPPISLSTTPTLSSIIGFICSNN